MTAVNQTPAYKNFMGRSGALLADFYVQAGSTQAIKKGEICKLRDISDLSTYPIVPVSANDAGFLPLIANKEQASGDAARLLQFVYPDPFTAFEFDLDAATEVKLGDKLAISDSQTLTVTTNTALAVATAWAVPNADGDWPSVSKVFAFFNICQDEDASNFPLLGMGIHNAGDVLLQAEADGTDGATITAPCDMEIIDAWYVRQDDTDGTAAITDADDNVIVAAKALGSTDKAVVRAESIDDAHYAVGEGEGVKLVITAGNAKTEVFIRGRRV